MQIIIVDYPEKLLLFCDIDLNNHLTDVVVSGIKNGLSLKFLLFYTVKSAFRNLI